MREKIGNRKWPNLYLVRNLSFQINYDSEKSESVVKANEDMESAINFVLEEFAKIKSDFSHVISYSDSELPELNGTVFIVIAVGPNEHGLPKSRVQIESFLDQKVQKKFAKTMRNWNADILVMLRSYIGRPNHK